MSVTRKTWKKKKSLVHNHYHQLLTYRQIGLLKMLALTVLYQFKDGFPRCYLLISSPHKVLMPKIKNFQKTKTKIVCKPLLALRCLNLRSNHNNNNPNNNLNLTIINYWLKVFSGTIQWYLSLKVLKYKLKSKIKLT